MGSIHSFAGNPREMKEPLDSAWGIMGYSCFEALKVYLYEYLSKKIPGMLSLLNVLCRTAYRTDCINLLLTSPSRLYMIVVSHYRGDIVSADYAFTIIFLSPLAGYLKRPEVIQHLLDLVKTGRDSEFAELIKKLLKNSLST